MIDYKLRDGDIVIEDNDTATTDATAQRLRQKLLLWRGEWWLDRQAGFPYLQRVLGQRPRPEVVGSLVRQLVERDPDVRSVDNLRLDFDATTRRIAIAFTARLVDGTNTDIEVTV